jgi:hypothetical protein
MVEADWGVDEQATVFDFAASDWEPVDSDRADDVPEVVAARARGYFPAHEAPLWCFIPAIWPSEARAWVSDYRVRHLRRFCEGGPSERLPWTTADYARHEQGANADLAALGLPQRPPGRIWLLRAPEPYATPQDVLDVIWSGWLASGGRAMATAELVEYADRRLREIF